MPTATAKNFQSMPDEAWMPIVDSFKKEIVSVSMNGKQKKFVEYHGWFRGRAPRFAEMSIEEFER